MTALLSLALLAPTADPPNPQERAKNAVVMVTTLPKQPGSLGVRTAAGNKPPNLEPNPVRDRKGLASGILFDAGVKDRLYVITVAHVVTSDDDIYVTVLDPKDGIRWAKCPLVHLDRGRDLAVLALSRDKALEERAVQPAQLEPDLGRVKKLVELFPEKRTIIAIGHPQGEGAKGGGLSWGAHPGHLIAVRGVEDAVKTILTPKDYEALDPVVKQGDCIEVDVTAGKGMSGGPVYLGDCSKILGLVWMGGHYTGVQRNVICIPVVRINELRLNKPNEFRIPKGFPQPPPPVLANNPPVKPVGGAIKSFICLPVPAGAAVNCYLDDDYLMRKFNLQTRNLVLRDRKWWDVTHNPTGLGLVIPSDYQLAEKTQEVKFFKEAAAAEVLELTATGKDMDRVTVHIYARNTAVKGNKYDQLVSEVVRYRRGILQLGLTTAPNQDDGFLVNRTREYADFADDKYVHRQEYVVGSNDVRTFRMYTHLDKKGVATRESTLSVIGIRGDKVVAASTTFQTADWNANAPLSFATRFFILATYSFVD